MTDLAIEATQLAQGWTGAGSGVSRGPCTGARKGGEGGAGKKQQLDWMLFQWHHPLADVGHIHCLYDSENAICHGGQRLCG